MVLMPKKTKWRKSQRGRMRGKAYRGSNIDFGNFGLIAVEPGWITGRQIEAARIAMNRVIRKVGKYWIRIFPDKPYTKKPLETRMGKGKGNVEGYVAVVRPGRVLFEVEVPNETIARRALRRAAMKLPIKTKFIAKEPF